MNELLIVWLSDGRIKSRLNKKEYIFNNLQELLNWLGEINA